MKAIKILLMVFALLLPTSALADFYVSDTQLRDGDIPLVRFTTVYTDTIEATSMTVTTSEFDTVEFGSSRTFQVILDSNTAATQDTTYTFPTDDGVVNEYLMTDGDGGLEWTMIDISNSTNLAGTTNQVILTGDTLSLPQDLDTAADLVLGSLDVDSTIVADTVEVGGDRTYGVLLDSSTSATEEYTLTLPVDNGDAGEVLITDGSGVMSFTDQPTACYVRASTWAASGRTFTVNGQFCFFSDSDDDKAYLIARENGITMAEELTLSAGAGTVP